MTYRNRLLPATPLRRLLAAATCFALGLLGFSTAPAAAGEYPVHACDPGFGDVNNSWYAERNTIRVGAYSACPSNSLYPWDKGLVTRQAVVAGDPHASASYLNYAAMVFRAPPGASLARITVEHKWCAAGGFNTGLINGANEKLLHVYSPNCTLLLPSPSTVDLRGTDLIKLMTICGQASCELGNSIRAYGTFRSAIVWVQDWTAPSVRITGGSVRKNTVATKFPLSPGATGSDVSTSSTSI